MTRPLRVLVAEDSESDFELLLCALRKGGYEPIPVRVETGEALSTALESQSWDIVFSDWSMPTFSALAALRLVKEKAADLPFIIVSGTIGEDIAVEALRTGAQDFLVKHKLARLIPAVERELREASARRERKKMQEQLMISDRMASVGILAAAVAHEINNPLASVLANLDLALRDLPPSPSDSAQDPRLKDVRDELSDARQAAERIRHIVRDLKLFSRADDDAHSAVEVRRVLESSLRMAGNEIRHRARLVRDYGAVPLVEANESRLGQVFLNLIVNAAQSMPEGRAETNEIRISTLMGPGGRVVVEIRDTGSGMAPDVLKRLFTPFFTTKPLGLGTGLGLSICHRIVAGLGGAITVESTLGSGSVFRVTLPPARTSTEAQRAVERAYSPPVRRGRVLVVDDEPMIVSAVRRTLAQDHEVVATSRAREALAEVAAGRRFDVILCDLMMPEMTGMDLHAELLRAAPDQAEKMVFLTGGAFTARARAFLDQVVNLRVEKPFDTIALRAIVSDRVK